MVDVMTDVIQADPEVEEHPNLPPREWLERVRGRGIGYDPQLLRRERRERYWRETGALWTASLGAALRATRVLDRAALLAQENSRQINFVAEEQLSAESHLAA